MTGAYNMKGVVPFVKVSSSGEMKIYNLITESMNVESYGNSIKPANDGGFIIGATTRFGPTFSYKFLAIKTDSNGFAPKLVTVQSNSEQINEFELFQNYPNPFNPETRIRFNLNKSSNVSLRIFDATGKVVADLINNKFYTSGDYSVAFNAAQYNLTSGVYFYKLTANSVSDLRKMILVK